VETGETAVSLAWHGGASYSLRLAEVEILVDPLFSRPGDYPPWFDEACANPHAPSLSDFLADHHPDYLFITHGHFDHFDLRTVERLAAAVEFTVVGSAEVLETCRRVLGLDPRRLTPCPVLGEGWLNLGPKTSARAAALPAPHWFTGAEGSKVAEKFAARPERFGAMPCGGPMLGYIFEVFKVSKPAGARPAAGGTAAFRLWASGDTEPAGFPAVAAAGPFDVALVSCGGRLVNPATRRLEPPYLDEDVLARLAVEYVRPRILVPVHYDLPLFKTPFNPAELGRRLAALSGGPGSAGPRLLVPPYNAWVSLV